MLQGYSQDAHFSLYNINTPYLSSALTGIDTGGIRLGIQYRSQWANIPDAYQTYNVYAEGRKKDWGWGAVVHHNAAGDASLATSGGWVSAAYHKALSDQGQILSLGVGTGFIQKRFDPATLLFESQYQDGAIQDNAEEAFIRTSIQRADFNIGVNWSGYIPTATAVNYRLGMSLAHMHRPSENFAQAISELPMKKSFYAAFDIGAGNAFIFSPHFLWQQQGVHKTIVAKTQLSIQMAGRNRFFLGIGTRLNDALLFNTGIQLDDLQVHLGYDVNISGLEVATQRRGAFEIALTYQISNQAKYVQKRTRASFPPPEAVPEKKDCHACPDNLKDTDGDGVVDAKDRCPYDPGYVYLEGCMDADKDGINDRDDGCPYLPGPKENYGCPSKQLDSDGDGIPDTQDHCIYLKGLKALNGCPDTDQDGISDVEDHCPYLKGVLANNGCPAKGTRAQNGWWQVLIEFDTDQSIIKHHYFTPLQEIAWQAMAQNDYEFIISGHTDTEGTDSYNYQLGQRRALAVQGFLIRQGIPPNKIKIFSYGEDVPVRENSTSFGKARNRRAEVTAIIK